jgi:uncharacterized protein
VDNEVMVARIYIRETEHARGKTLMQEILNILHDQQRVRGVTVFRGIAGFGDSGEMHAADLLRLSVALPIVIEFFDTPSVVEAALTLLDGLVPAGHILSWRAVQHKGATPAPRVEP